jgi:hypothetical protein
MRNRVDLMTVAPVALTSVLIISVAEIAPAAAA